MKQNINISFLFFIIITFITNAVHGHVIERRSTAKVTDLPEFTDCSISVFSWVNQGLGWGFEMFGEGECFLFTLGMDQTTFLEKYEVSGVILNDKRINGLVMEYQYDKPNGFRFYSNDYKDMNILYMIIRNKETNKFYVKRFVTKTLITS
ncbi:hypothetical protein PIROE2DRAFT_16368 [Piromyces sp. E2]|nr:hypothetical protein PIROE2DRAFT_16368 [Piromyces sp. E2]|eukprot:OUM58381.1 hypothetical protein PIROE2DRAFT_16368 [Piromyces sp. E2]